MNLSGTMPGCALFDNMSRVSMSKMFFSAVQALSSSSSTVEIISSLTPLIASSECESKAIKVMFELGCKIKCSLDCPRGMYFFLFLALPCFDSAQALTPLSLWWCGAVSQPELSSVYRAYYLPARTSVYV